MPARTNPAPWRSLVFWLAAAAAPGLRAQNATPVPPPAFDLPNFAVASQQAVNWCWAAANQMVSSSLGAIVQQCELAQRRFGFDCCQANWSCGGPDSDALFRCDATSAAFNDQDPIAFSQNNAPNSVLPLADIRRILAVDKSPIVAVRGSKRGSVEQHYVVLTGYSSTASRGLLLKVFDPDCTPAGVYADGYTYAAYGGDDPNYGYGQEAYDFRYATPITPPAPLTALATPPPALTADKVSQAVSFTATARQMVADSADSAGQIVKEVKADPGFAVAPSLQPFDLAPIAAVFAKGSFPSQISVMSIALDDLRHYRAALTPKRIMEQSEVIATVVQDRKLMEAVFLAQKDQAWTPYRYGGVGIVRSLFQAMADDSARSKTVPGDYFVVFIPGIETYFLARETGQTLHMIPLSTRRQYGIVAGTDLIGREFLEKLGNAIDKEMTAQGK